ncbi:MAG: hypothetical protein ABSB32_11395 [Thermodesulfobacteriota bacterium]
MTSAVPQRVAVFLVVVPVEALGPAVSRKERMKIMPMIFEPISIKNVKVRNRIARSATFDGMGNARGEPTKRHAQLYATLAEGEVGLIITSATLVERFRMPLPEGQEIAYSTFIDRDELVEPWKPECIAPAG